MSLDRDVDYDTETQKITPRMASAHKQVTQTCRKVLELHGALPLDCPSLLPRGKAEDWVYSGTDSVVQVMTRSGDTVSLPFDLRVSFARYLARTRPGQFKRYCFGKVLREKRVFGLHPKELTECAFDIVTSDPSVSSLADAELLVVCEEIMTEVGLLGGQHGSKLYYRLSHGELLSGVLDHFGVSAESRGRVVRALKSWESLPRAAGQLTGRLAALGLPEPVSSSLAGLLEAEVSLSQLSSVLRLVTKRKGEAGERVKTALNHLRQVEELARSLGLSLDLMFSVRTSSSSIMSGLGIQLLRVRQGKAGRKAVDILAAGGRYDGLVRTFSETVRISEPEPELEQGPLAAGMSVSVDKLVAGLLKSEDFSLDSAQLVIAGDLLEAGRTVRELWSNNLSSLLERTERTDEAVEVRQFQHQHDEDDDDDEDVDNDYDDDDVDDDSYDNDDVDDDG